MEALNAAALPARAVLLVDSAPIIYTLEANERCAGHFARMFQRHVIGELLLAVTTITIAEVLTGPLNAGEAALAWRYRAVLDAWLSSISPATSPRAPRGCASVRA